MDLIKIKPKIISLTTIVILFNSILKIFCLIEIPIKIINPSNIPKYKGIRLKPENPPLLQNIINIYNNNTTHKNLKWLS